MNVVQLISKKRDGGELSADEIGSLIAGYVRGDVPDYQMAAWAMAVYLRGMTVAEIAALTEHMLHSGVTFEWPAGESPKVDKHSTGGIGDKVSLAARAAARLLRFASADDLRPRPRRNRRHARQARSHPRLPHEPFSTAEMQAGRPQSRLRDQRRHRRPRPGRPQALRPPRRHGHRPLDPAHHRQHHEQEAGRRTRRARARREIRQRRVHENARRWPGRSPARWSTPASGWACRPSRCSPT